MIFIADFIACSTCFGQYYAHHQELESIIQMVTPHHTDNLKTKAPNTTGIFLLYNTLELLMMGILLPETCWACNKICNKYHLLNLVGILFPHSKIRYSMSVHKHFPACRMSHRSWNTQSYNCPFNTLIHGTLFWASQSTMEPDSYITSSSITPWK